MSKVSELIDRGIVTGFKTMIVIPLLVGFGSVIATFPMMLALGIYHHEVDESVPALGFWPTLGLVWGLSAFIGRFIPKHYKLFKDPTAPDKKEPDAPDKKEPEVQTRVGQQPVRYR